MSIYTIQLRANRLVWLVMGSTFMLAAFIILVVLIIPSYATLSG